MDDFMVGPQCDENDELYLALKEFAEMWNAEVNSSEPDPKQFSIEDYLFRDKE